MVGETICSQPPLLSSMVVEKRTSDMDLVKKALPSLIKEHKTKKLHTLVNDCEKEQLYHELALTAETSWGFSTRRMK
ncbi:trehalase [Artemisia annua]|uniref:Trehalase n=1 Tax=Artemisia annua TaxID=35608 RepID=A0A2U1P7T2_ARTAN|nr:trehalase [Artemisia annua]